MVVNWMDYFKSIEFLPPMFDKLATKPEDGDMDLYQLHTGFKLPLAYRSFAKSIGPGELAFDFRLRVPYAPRGKSVCLAEPPLAKVSLECFNFDLRTKGVLRPEVIDTYDDPEKRINRLVYFSDNTAGDLVGWDPLQLVEPSELEYAMYLVLGEERSIEFLTNRFYAFIDDSCYLRREKLSDDPVRNREENYVFQPASYPARQGQRI